ncbi:MAG: triose-phosphate isomerase [Legionellaceae bacterium]|nr:triose-phosphate isomerase [Legionellaceae bacterium]
MRQKIVAANWKMNGNLQTITSLLNEFKFSMSKLNHAECVIFPPSLYVPLVQQMLSCTHIKWGVQNIYPQNYGAFTGEISLSMIHDFNCKYVMVGHSERRQIFSEDEKFITEKFHQTKEYGMIPLLCIGESQEDLDHNRTREKLAYQLETICMSQKFAFRNCVIAYEPIWAIGTGKTPRPNEIQFIHELIRVLIKKISCDDASKIPILYGGSVNQNNALEIFSLPDVDGGLIGGASLDAKQFLEIIKCIN